MTISIVTGLPGFGKTLKLAEFGYKANVSGKMVYSNFKMQNLPNPELYMHYNDPLEVLGKVDNALILMSEVGILLDSHKIWDLPHEVWDELRQHRKDGVNIICDAQSMDDTASKFRRLIQFQYHIYMKMTLPSITGIGYRDEKGKWKVTFQLARVRNPQRGGQDFGRRYWIFNPKYFHYYDTNYKLERTPSLFERSQEMILSPYMDEEYERYQKLLLA